MCIRDRNSTLLVQDRFEKEESIENETNEINVILETQKANFSVCLEEKPSFESSSSKEKNFVARKINYENKSRMQRKLGLIGEDEVVKFEKQKLTDIGKKELSKKVKHVSVLDGDGAGYDILSYDEKGQEIYIEVKTTNKDKEEPFYMSETEIAFSMKNPTQYRLYRLFDFDVQNKKYKLYILEGDITKNVTLIPKQFQVTAVGKSGDLQGYFEKCLKNINKS